MKKKSVKMNCFEPKYIVLQDETYTTSQNWASTYENRIKNVLILESD